MTPEKKIGQHSMRALLSFAVLAVIYTLLVFILPANKETMHMYHLTPQGYHILLSLATLPPLAVWLAAFLAYGKLYEYVDLIKSAGESPGFIRIAQGIKWLAWSLAISSIVDLIANAITNTTANFHPAAIIINNYLALILPLVGYSLIGSGSRALMAQAKRSFSVVNAQGIMLSFACGGVLYCYLTFRQLHSANLASTHNPYALPVWLVIVSVIIPYLYAWFVGLLAVLEINSYSKRVRGLLYRQPLRLKAVGLSMVIIGSIALQFLGAVVPASGHIVLDYRLVLRLLFLAFAGVGFLLIILGVLRLKKIEEV